MLRIYAATVVLCTASLFGQTGSILGVITDSSSAAIPSADVTVINSATGLARNSQTDGQGNYAVRLLPVGTYRVEARKAGFGTSVREEIKLDVEQVSRIDITLKPGATTETIQVSAAAQLLDSETSTVGQVIDNKRIVELPLNGRNYLALALLTAGAVPDNLGRTGGEGGFSASGQHQYQVNVTVDGLDNTTRASGGPLGYEAQAVKPSLDAVEEFRVVTNNLAAEFGYRMGGQVFVTTKSGTNLLHGTGYEFLRNDKFDGTNFFANRNGSGKPSYRQNQFGGTLGGPLRRDKTFLFGSYEGLRIRLGNSFVSTVPTLLERTGNFNEIRPIFDPATTTGTGATLARTQFPSNIVPPSRWDPLFPKLLALYPLPTGPGITSNYFFSPTESNDSNSYDFKGDHAITDTSRISARYSRRDKNRYQPGPLPLPADGGLATTTSLVSHSAVLNHTQVFSPTLTNEFRFGSSVIRSQFDIPYSTALFSDFGIKGIPKTNLASSNDHGLSLFTPAGYAQLGSRAFWPNFDDFTLYQFNDVAYKTLSSHTVKFGIEFHKENVDRNAARFARGQFNFSREFTANPADRARTGDGLAEFMLGLAASGTLSNENGESINANYLGTFVQDDWKVNRKLTLNLGLRYEIFFAPTFPAGKVTNFIADLSQTGPNARLQYERPKDGSDCLCEQDLNNFGPRIGLAYQLTPKTVIRSGFGIIYGQADQYRTQVARANNQAPDFISLSFATTDRINARLVLKDGFPPVELPATTIPGPNLVGASTRPRFLPTQYSEQRFFDLQRELPGGVLVTLGYNGNETHHLLSAFDYNLPQGPSAATVASRRLLPYYTSISTELALGNLSYNAFTWKMEKRFARGLQFLSSYTWAHAIDNVGEEYNDTTGQGSVNPYNRALDRASSVTDVRHSYVLSSTYELPFGRGRAYLTRGRFTDYLLGGWQVGGILTLRTGTPFTVTTTGGITNAGGEDRPNRLRDGTLPGGQRTVDQWFDLSAFTIQPQYTYGNSGRNILRGPGLKNVDFTLQKFFTLRERLRLQFRAEAFNLTNTPAFGLPNGNLNGTGGGQITTAGEPRRIQCALKLLF